MTTSKQLEHQKKYYSTHLDYYREYRKTEKYKIYQRKYHKTYIDLNKSQTMKKYFNTEQGKIIKAKNRKKRKHLNWVLMFDNPFSNLEMVEYHHIDDCYVIAIPKDLHRVYLGKNHRENTMEIVKQIYLGDKKA